MAPCDEEDCDDAKPDGDPQHGLRDIREQHAQASPEVARLALALRALATIFPARRFTILLKLWGLEHILDHVQQRVWRAGLFEHDVAASLSRAFGGIAADRNDVHVARRTFLSQRTRKLEPVHAGHRDIGDDNIWPVLARALEHDEREADGHGHVDVAGPEDAERHHRVRHPGLCGEERDERHDADRERSEDFGIGDAVSASFDGPVGDAAHRGDSGDLTEPVERPPPSR